MGGAPFVLDCIFYLLIYTFIFLNESTVSGKKKVLLIYCLL